MYPPLSSREEQIATAIVDAAYRVHRELGPGLLERVYEACFCYELEQKGLHYQRQVVVPVKYRSMSFDEGFRLDVLVENLVICELKAVAALLPVHEAQLLTYMKLSGIKQGFLLNFNVSMMKEGIKSFVI